MTGIDTAISEFFSSFTGKYFLVDGIFIFFAEYLIYILSAVFLLYVLKIKDWRERVRILSLGALGVILSRGIFTPLIRFFFERPRPFVALDIESLISHANTGSFPSGHITFITPLILILWYINRRTGIWSLAGALLIGIARVGVGVHWMTDILGGFLVGFVAYAIAHALLKIKNSPKPEEALPPEAG